MGVTTHPRFDEGSRRGCDDASGASDATARDEEATGTDATRRRGERGEAARRWRDAGSWDRFEFAEGRIDVDGAKRRG